MSGCTERQFQPGFEDDGIAPSVSIVKTSGDTLNIDSGLQFGVSAADNLGLKSLTIEYSGGYNAAMDSVFTSAVTSVAFAVTVDLAGNTTAGGMVYITATAVDGNNNTASVQDSLYLINEDALTVSIERPSSGALTSQGRQIVVELVAQHSAGVQYVGYLATGIVTDSNSVAYSSPLPTFTTFVDTLTVPASAPEGTFTIQGFVGDSTGRTATSAVVVVTVQSVTNDTDPPIVSFSINTRVEVDDSITVRATDPGGIQQVGWYALLRDDTTQQVGVGSAAVGGGTLTDVSHTWPLNFNFPATDLPRFVVIRAWAEDANGNRDTTATATGASGGPQAGPSAAAAASSDTVLVVHGTTTPLPDGGSVIDGIYNRNLNEVYLTNVDLGRIEVFQVSDTSFVAGGVSVGSRPWGIALWPQNVTTGANADTVVVANSGGTDLSIVDLQLRREVRRHSLPNFVVDEVTTEADDATGTIQLKFTRHDFSDRPQYLGMTCRPGAGACNANGITAVYSTTPTIDQDALPLRGSLRWENLTSVTPSSHFFWEHAQVPPHPDFDTLRVFVDRGPTVPLDTVLATACGIMVNVEKLVFRETTFVRNSGDFSHALAGEGGVIEGDNFAQAVGFDAGRGILPDRCSGTITVGAAPMTFSGPIETDLGITPSFRVSDFISNTATIVNSIAINFNGLTNLIRTSDSVYVLNEELRLKGLISERGDVSGMDLNFDHNFEAGVGGTAGTFGGTGNPDDRLVFVAVAEAEIEVYDTFFFEKVITLPIRDPIIGPLRVAKLASGDQILVGVTAYGVVTVQLPSITNTFPAAEWGTSQQ
jgi:hypothetical protein